MTNFNCIAVLQDNFVKFRDSILRVIDKSAVFAWQIIVRNTAVIGNNTLKNAFIIQNFE